MLHGHDSFAMLNGRGDGNCKCYSKRLEIAHSIAHLRMCRLVVYRCLPSPMTGVNRERIIEAASAIADKHGRGKVAANSGPRNRNCRLNVGIPFWPAASVIAVQRERWQPGQNGLVSNGLNPALMSRSGQLCCAPICQ